MPPPRIYQVAQLNRRIAQALGRWGDVWVEGEISDLRRAASGHVYLTLNDSEQAAQIRCVMFSTDAQRARAQLENDARVRLNGRFDLYQPRGSFQLIARVALPAGQGDRREQIRRLKKKLAAEGLFAVGRKRMIPKYPRVVGVVTSRHGAALHDVVRVARQRAPVRLVLSHCVVQGADAPASIVMALRRVAKLERLDVVILTRGGGSSEDLAAFNDERVARAIAACPVPVVSGVGHEVDGSIADLVADLRAATPSNAAELVVPDLASLVEVLDARCRRLQRGMEMQIGVGRLALERLQKKLSDPRHALSSVRRKLDIQKVSLARAAHRSTQARRAELAAIDRRLRQQDPRVVLHQQRRELLTLQHLLRDAARRTLDTHRSELNTSAARLSVCAPSVTARRRHRLQAIISKLDALSPLRVLARGYAIVLADGDALVDASSVRRGDRVHIRLAEGALDAEVLEVTDAPGEVGET